MNLHGEILGLAIAYAALGVLLLIAVTRANLPWMAKAGMIVATSLLYIVVFFRLQGLLGWASYETLPPRFELLWARVVESNFVNNEDGAIYLWVETLDDANRPSLVPRAYVLPYSSALAAKIQTAKSEISHGRHQVGRPTDFGVGGGELVGSNLPSRTGGGPGGDPSGGGLLDSKFLGGGAPSIDFAPLPPPILPPKEEP
ncbi:MAG: hypothetical protein ABWZ19_03330 [Hyphomicrobium sp.]